MSMTSTDPRLAVDTQPTTTGQRVAGWIGLVLHGVAALPYLFSGLVAPVWGVAVLWAVWLVLLAVALRLRVAAPWWTLAVGPGAFAVWGAFVSFGDIVLGWTA